MNKRKISNVIRRNRGNLLFLFLLKILLLFPFLLEPVFKGIFTEYILTEGYREWLFPLLSFLIGTAFLSAIVNWIQESCLLYLTNKIDISDTSRDKWILLNAPLHFFEKRDNLLINQPKELGSVRISNFLDRLFFLVTAAFYLLMMLKIDKVMTVIAVTLAFLNYSVLKIKQYTEGRRQTEEEPEQETDELVIQEEQIGMLGLRNLEVFKATASEEFFYNHLIGCKMKVVNAKRQEDYMEAYEPIDSLPEVIFMNLLLFISAFRIMEQSFSIGAYLVFQAYAAAFFYPLGEVLKQEEEIKETSIRWKEYHEQPERFRGVENRAQLSLPPVGRLKGKIEFCNVSFGYDNRFPVIRNVSFSVKSGQRIAVLGKPGAGKTTLLKLLQGMYELDSGEITIDGIAPSKIEKNRFIKSIGCADQEITLFTASIRQNITMWDETVTEEEICYAASDACIHDDITSLDGAYDYRLTENGNNLSGGQRQRLEIARALLYQPSIVLFDEATSSIDPSNRDKIEDNLVKRGCTVIAVTHILDRLPEYDKIIILDKGMVTAMGNHDELLLKSDYYTSLNGSVQEWSENGKSESFR